ncbi:unnamed protein product, partial [Allacma fusca]
MIEKKILEPGFEFFVAPFRTALRHYPIKDDGDIVLFLVEIISYPLIVGEFLLNCWADSASAFRKASGPDVLKGRKDRLCPKSQSSTLNRLLFVADLLSFVQPQILNLLILFVSGDEELWKGYFYAALLLATDMVSNLTRNQHLYVMFMTAYRIKAAVMSAVYRKALVVSNATRRERTTGEIVNLMSVDVNKIGDLVPFICILWGAPIQIAIALYFLWGILGPSSLASIGVMVLLIPINTVVTNKLKSYQISQMKSKDQRVKLMSEVLSGMKILKLYAWEPSFQNQVMKIREKEVQTLTSLAYAAAFNDFLFTCSQFLVTLVTFATFVFVDEKNVLDARTAFVALSLLNVMSKPLTMFPMVIVYGV